MSLKKETANGGPSGLSHLGCIGWSIQQTIGRAGGSDQVWLETSEFRDDSKIFLVWFWW